jgi:hypothetical protein
MQNSAETTNKFSFRPMLSKKSLEIAKHLESSSSRLLRSKSSKLNKSTDILHKRNKQPLIRRANEQNYGVEPP